MARAPLKKTTRVQRVSRNLGIERTQKLKQLASRQKISAKTEHGSIFNVFAALLFTYLYRVTGNRRQSVGTPLHNRRSKAFKDTIGLLMQVLPLQITIGQDDTFISLIRKIALEAPEVFRHSHALGNSSDQESLRRPIELPYIVTFKIP